MTIKYVGNKSGVLDDILPIILQDGYDGQTYVEPFVGSAAVISRVPSTFRRIGADKNPFVVALHEAIRDGWIPPESVSEAEYQEIKRAPSKYPKELVGFVSIACSFGGKMWGGYARGKTAKGGDRNYASEGVRALADMPPRLKGIEFRVSSYAQLHIPDSSIVYCDPPYENTTGYEYSIKNFGEFWDWCEKLVLRDCRVFVSGYITNKPSTWDVVWQKTVKTHLDGGKHLERTENLFTKYPIPFPIPEATTDWLAELG